MHLERPAALDVVAAGGLGVVVDSAHHAHGRTQFGDAPPLEQGRHLRDEDRRRDAQTAGHPGDRLAVVAPRGGRHANPRNGGTQQAVRRAAWLEAAGVLEQLGLEHEPHGGVEPEGPRSRPQQRGPSHRAHQPIGGGVDVASLHDILHDERRSYRRAFRGPGRPSSPSTWRRRREPTVAAGKMGRCPRVTRSGGSPSGCDRCSWGAGSCASRPPGWLAGPGLVPASWSWTWSPGASTCSCGSRRVSCCRPTCG